MKLSPEIAFLHPFYTWIHKASAYKPYDTTCQASSSGTKRLFSESLILLSCHLSLPNTSSICHSTLVCIVFILLLLPLCGCRSGQTLQKLSLGETNQHQIPSFSVCAKNITQKSKNRKSWSWFHVSWRNRKGAGVFREILAVLASKTTGWYWFCRNPQFLNDKLSFQLQNTFNTKGNQRRGKLLSQETTKMTKTWLGL